MNLIEKLGGYAAAEMAYSDAIEDGDTRISYRDVPDNIYVSIVELKLALLAYRREHKIYEPGDRVVLTDICDSCVVSYECRSDNPIGLCWVSYPIIGLCWVSLDGIRHATDAEIEANKRLPHVGDTVRYEAYFCGEFKTGCGKITQIDKDSVTLDDSMIVDISELV